MKQTYRHLSGLDISTEFSEECPPLFRYRLSATKQGARDKPKTVCAIMQNPSYACDEFADRSVQVLERVIFEKGYPEFKDVERLIVVNQFAFIQTNDFDGNQDQIGPLNEAAINRAVSESDIILIAWGRDNQFTERKRTIGHLLRSAAGKILLQTSRHPSRVIYNGFIEVCDSL